MKDIEEHETIKDESRTGFETTTDKGLIQNLYRNDPRWLERSKLEMTRRLKKEIGRFNETSSKQTDTLIKLTKGLIGLTIAMIIGIGIQIGLLIFRI